MFDRDGSATYRRITVLIPQVARIAAELPAKPPNLPDKSVARHYFGMARLLHKHFAELSL